MAFVALGHSCRGGGCATAEICLSQGQEDAGQSQNKLELKVKVVGGEKGVGDTPEEKQGAKCPRGLPALCRSSVVW